MKYITQMFNIIFDKYAIHINDNLIQEILLSIKKRNTSITIFTIIVD